MTAHDYTTRTRTLKNVLIADGWRQWLQPHADIRWRVCTRCGCSERAIEAWGWACVSEGERNGILRQRD